ncbi:hypothetical protein L1887_08363 [Cichorium endivia]|nr:hypothetical protein L1887_08363 [Cichorium endivia]
MEEVYSVLEDLVEAGAPRFGRRRGGGPGLQGFGHGGGEGFDLFVDLGHGGGDGFDPFVELEWRRRRGTRSVCGLSPLPQPNPGAPSSPPPPPSNVGVPSLLPLPNPDSPSLPSSPPNLGVLSLPPPPYSGAPSLSPPRSS